MNLKTRDKMKKVICILALLFLASGCGRNYELSKFTAAKQKAGLITREQGYEFIRYALKQDKNANLENLYLQFRYPSDISGTPEAMLNTTADTSSSTDSTESVDTDENTAATQATEDKDPETVALLYCWKVDVGSGKIYKFQESTTGNLIYVISPDGNSLNGISVVKNNTGR
jgi:hypothetical protein